MKTAVVYESFYGNTGAIAWTVAAEAARHGDVTAGDVDAVPPERLGDVDLLIVGSPTRLRGPSRGIAHWLVELPPMVCIDAAVFDTRWPGPAVYTGSSALETAHALRLRGCQVIVRPESFYIRAGTTGELLHGESERAQEWAAHLLKKAQRIQAWRQAV